jgi:ribosomal protein S18 acetylase RimI-like enzyme
LTGEGPIIRRATRDDLEPLRRLTVEAFHQAYDGKSPASEIEAHVARHFGARQILAEITDEEAIVLVVESSCALLGYALLRPGSGTALAGAGRPVELCRIYFDARETGRGYGSSLMKACVDAARAAGGEILWLSVWEENHAAIRFYERWQFRRAGTQPFDFGGTLYEDPVMVRRLTCAS